MVVVSLLSGQPEAHETAVKMLVRRLGPLCYLSAPLAFDYTDYYEAEMGPGLTRRLAAFEQLVAPIRLAVIKRVCMSLEKDLSQGRRRRVNLDPGLLSADALVLATSKPRGHRLCLSEGIYGEVTLLFHRGDFISLPWTYQDYAGPELKDVLNLLRDRYLWKLRQEKGREEDLD
jgi:hypothetical protein